jgi:hypothetical protein
MHPLRKLLDSFSTLRGNTLGKVSEIATGKQMAVTVFSIHGFNGRVGFVLSFTGEGRYTIQANAKILYRGNTRWKRSK